MFDIGIFELLVVGGVALVVIGPERLPGAIRTGALWVGRLKRSILETRRELEQHIGADEIRRELRNEEIMASLEKLREVRAQLERDIQSHTSGAALEHGDDAHHDHDHDHDHGHDIDHHSVEEFKEQRNEYSDGSYHNQNNNVDKTKMGDKADKAHQVAGTLSKESPSNSTPEAVNTTAKS